MPKIIEIRSNIFNTSLQTIVNTVNCVGVMGKGIALEFRYRYPDMYEKYVELCDKGQIQPGVLWLWTKSKPWILNFPTKRHWKFPSKIQYIELGLRKFAETYKEKKITSIAFPILGSSSGGLDESRVIKMMNDYLEPLQNLEIEIYHFDPNASDDLFKRLYQKIYRFDLDDYRKIMGLRQKEAYNIHQAIKNNMLHSMVDLQKLEGVGIKTIGKVYNFLNSSKQRVQTIKEIQPSLF